MTDDRLHKLFVSRSHYLRLSVAADDATTGGRIGGRPPEACLAAEPCPRCGGPMIYYLTVDFSRLLNSPQEVSVLLCRDFDCLLKGSASSRLRLPSSLRCLVHEPSPRSPQPTALDSEVAPRALRSAPREAREDEDEPAENSKIGGRVGLIQKEGIDEALAAEGWDFLLQWNELDFPRGMHIGTYPLAGGALYFFAAFRGNAPYLNELRAFWQRS